MGGGTKQVEGIVFSEMIQYEAKSCVSKAYWVLLMLASRKLNGAYIGLFLNTVC